MDNSLVYVNCECHGIEVCFVFLFSAPKVPVFGLGALSDSEQEEGKITTVIFLCNIF